MINLSLLALTLFNLAGKPVVLGIAEKLVVFSVAYAIKDQFCIGFWNGTLLVYQGIYPLDAMIVNNTICMVSIAPASNGTKPLIVVGCGNNMYTLASLAKTPPPYRVGFSTEGKPYFIAGHSLVVFDKVPRYIRLKGFQPVDYLGDVIVALRLSRERATALIRNGLAQVLEGFEAIDSERIGDETLLLAGVYQGHYAVAKIDLLKGKAVVYVFTKFKPPEGVNILDASIASCSNRVCAFVLNNSVLIWGENTIAIIENLGIVKGVYLQGNVVTVASLVESVKPLKPRLRVVKCPFRKIEVTLYNVKAEVIEGRLKPYEFVKPKVVPAKPKLAKLGENLQLSIFTLKPRTPGTGRGVDIFDILKVLTVFMVGVATVTIMLWIWRRGLGGVRSSPSG